MSGKFVARNFSTRSISNYVSISENLDGLRSDRNDIKGKLLHKLKESEFFPIISFHSNLIRVCCSRCYCIFHGRALFSNFYCLNFVFKIFRKFRDISVKSTKYSLFKHPRRRVNILMILKKKLCPQLLWRQCRYTSFRSWFPCFFVQCVSANFRGNLFICSF